MAKSKLPVEVKTRYTCHRRTHYVESGQDLTTLAHAACMSVISFEKALLQPTGLRVPFSQLPKVSLRLTCAGCALVLSLSLSL